MCRVLFDRGQRLLFAALLPPCIETTSFRMNRRTFAANPVKTFGTLSFVKTRITYNAYNAGGDCFQINTLRDLDGIVENTRLAAPNAFWRMSNGYVLPVDSGSIGRLGARLMSEEGLRERSVAALRVGIHWDTEVSACDVE